MNAEITIAERLHQQADNLDALYLEFRGWPEGDFILARIKKLRERAYRLEASK